MVMMFSSYSLRAKNRPTSTRHRLEPIGSSTTPPSPLAMNCAGAPMTVSEPNQVAKVVAMTTAMGRLRPATA